MSLKAGEIGKLYQQATSYNLSAFTALTAVFTHSDGTTFTVTSPELSAPAVDTVIPVIGHVQASTYVQYTTVGTDFTKPGIWACDVTYEDSSPKKYFADTASFTVE